jgi:ABC-type transport system involved in multi-copper enzyme maturation permease subunit
VRIAFNPNITTAWFTSVMSIINNVTMLAIILAGAALAREREHGTMDHLLVMPLTPFEIAMSKVWANGLVITVAVGVSLYVVVRTILGIPIAGSIPLFMVGVAIYLFFATAIGIFLGTVARSMPQLGLLYMLVYLPMNMRSGSKTPLESMPPWLATVMQASPSTHFVSFAQSILYRGAGIDVVWPQFLAVALIGGLFFSPRRQPLTLFASASSPVPRDRNEHCPSKVRQAAPRRAGGRSACVFGHDPCSDSPPLSAHQRGRPRAMARKGSVCQPPAPASRSDSPRRSPAACRCGVLRHSLVHCVATSFRGSHFANPL